MAKLRIQILGFLSATRSGEVVAPLPQNVRHLLGLLAAAGPDGMDREALASELWHGSPPPSWPSALRNRATRVRQHVDPDCLTRIGSRLSLASPVSVDSWDLLARSANLLDHQANSLEMLEGDVLAGLPPSPVVDAHRSTVEHCRVDLIQELVSDEVALDRVGLQRIREYVRRYPHNARLAFAAVEAHQLAGFGKISQELVGELGARLDEDGERPDWFRGLEDIVGPTALQAASTERAIEAAAADERHQRLFNVAVVDEDWQLALEIAMAGLPAAEKIEGDPARLKMLEAIPLARLSPSERFTLATALARNLLFVGREEEALKWGLTTTELAVTPNDDLLAYITRAMVGDCGDERLPMALPESFDDAPLDALSLRSLQVAVMSYLERDSSESASRMQKRFETLVEASGEPYRRWHLLLLRSMTHFVAGRLGEASEAADHAYSYASVFNIADAETGLIGQLSNPGIVDPGRQVIRDYPAEFPGTATTDLSRALQALTRAPDDGGEAMERFLATFNHQGAAVLKLAITALVAPFARQHAARKEIQERLRRRSGTSAILGTGVLHVGPVDRALALTQRDSAQATTDLLEAIKVADRQNTKIWQVTCRLDLGVVSSKSSHRHEAEKFADTDELMSLLETYESPFHRL